MLRHPRRDLPGILVLLTLLSAMGCGSKTGLKIPEFDASPDAELDTTPDVPDTAVDTEVCIPFRSRAELASLDIYVLLDSSGSMEELTADGLTKADALYGALEGFLTAEDSEGLGAALTFFPIEDESVSEFCDSDDVCGGGDESCFAPDVCSMSSQACRNDADCPEAGETCLDLGRCEGTEDFCVIGGGFGGCGPAVRCVDFGLCINRISCDTSDYRRPVVPLGLLPENAPRIIEALTSREIDGGTPTLPALTGVMERARRRTIESPGSKVIVLLATDGFPESCDDNLPSPYDPDPDRTLGIPAPAEIAAAGARGGIETFVVGVFEPEEEELARENLSRLALAGGTDEALIVTTEFNVTERLLEVFTEVRESVQTCIYSIPAEGAVPDPRDLDVRLLERGGDERRISRVDSLEDCRGDGYFFEGDLMPGDRPGYLELCPASCEFAERDDVFVEMQSGCEME